MIASTLAWAAPAAARTLELPNDLAREVVSETVPTAFAPGDLRAEDFVVTWVGEPLPGVQAGIVPGTLQWVRVAEVMLLPRGRLLVTGENVENARLTASAATQGAVAVAGQVAIELPLALLSGPRHRIEIVIVRGGQQFTGSLQVRFAPRRPATGPRVFFDPSCSRFALTADVATGPDDRWMLVGCRPVLVKDAAHATTAIDMLVYWDGAGPSVPVDGVGTPDVAPGLWALSVRGDPGQTQFGSGDSRVTLRYRTPARFRRGFIGAGVGGYAHLFALGADHSNSYAPLVTLYGSFFFTDTLRLVLFDATAIEAHVASDLGLYLHIEWFRFLDRRIGVNLLLGAHVLGFRSQGRRDDRYSVRFSTPQGLEATFTDAGPTGYNLTAGAFVYPNVAGRSYYNIWLRWGPARWFVELNYIDFTESVNADLQLRARSVGLTAGLPLLRFF